MLIWKIERHDDYGYDENVAHVVIAEYEMQAREIAASVKARDEDGGIWYAPTTKVTHVGEAHFELEPGVVLTNYRAG